MTSATRQRTTAVYVPELDRKVMVPRMNHVRCAGPRAGRSAR